MPPEPKSVLSRELLPASIAIYTLVGLAAFDALGVAAALPELAADLGDVDLLPWVVTSFLLVSGVSTVLAGALVDSLGVRIIFRVAAVVFLIGGLAAGLATSMGVLIAARALQGLGGGALVSVGLAAVNLIYPARLVARAFAANSTVWGVMGVAGPGIAAFLLTFASWHWIFFVNLPLGIVAMAMGWNVMPGPLAEPGSLAVDGVGLGMVFVFNLVLLFAVDGLNAWSALLAAAALGVAALYLRHARRRPEPVIKRRHLVEPPFGLLGWSITLLIVGGIAVHSFFTLYIRGARGGGEAITAWSVMFFVVGWTAGANLSSRLLDRMADSRVILIGFVTSISGLLGAAMAADSAASLWVLFAAMFAVGSGIGMATNAGLTLLQATAASTEIGRATAAHQFYRNIGFTLGAALGGAVILFVVEGQIGNTDAVRDLLAGAEEPSTDGTAGAISDGFVAAALVGTAVATAGLAPLFGLRRHLEPARRLADRARQTPSRYAP